LLPVWSANNLSWAFSQKSFVIKAIREKAHDKLFAHDKLKAHDKRLNFTRFHTFLQNNFLPVWTANKLKRFVM
jgi:hypothetical protein